VAVKELVITGRLEVFCTVTLIELEARFPDRSVAVAIRA
jgi:hypothetical protein